jgi:hypothetical protein
MRSTLITGLLVSMPSAVLLALAALAVLIGNLRRRLQRALYRRLQGQVITIRSEISLADRYDREHVRSDAQSLDSVPAPARATSFSISAGTRATRRSLSGEYAAGPR